MFGEILNTPLQFYFHSSMSSTSPIVSSGHVHVVSGFLMFHIAFVMHVTPNHERVSCDQNQDIDIIFHRISRVPYSSFVFFFSLYILTVY